VADLRPQSPPLTMARNALFGRTTPRRLQFTAIVSQSLRSNFQVGNDIAIGRTVAATKFVVPFGPSDPGEVSVPRSLEIISL
jgi:hypothetical protein